MKFKEIHGYEHAPSTIMVQFEFDTVKYTCQKIAAANTTPGLWIPQTAGNGHFWVLFEATTIAPLRASLFFNAGELYPYCMRVQLQEEHSHLFV